MTQTIDPYEWEVFNTQITSGISLRGKHGFGTSAEAAPVELNVVASDSTFDDGTPRKRGDEQDLRDEDEPEPRRDDSGRGLRSEEDGLAWNVSGSFSYFQPRTGDTRSTLNVNGSIDLTRSWRVTYSTQYDIQTRESLGQYFTVHRDLHCWEMSFTRRQLGDEWEFYFRLSLRSHPEIYVEEGERGLGGTGGFTSSFGY
jgi:lipopolysaccharide assembly outer membrane protein LptD (OstA)